MLNRKELQKVIKQETKELSKTLVFSEEDDLTLKLSSKQIKNALKPEPDKTILPHEFTSEFLAFLTDFRKYEVFEAESVTIELDSTCEKRYLDGFMATWKKHFAGRIVKQDADMKSLRRKNAFSLLWGIASLLIFIGLQIVGVFFPSKATQIVSICAEALLILCWVLIWSFFEDIIFNYKTQKTKLTDLYLSYAAKFIITSPKSKKVEIVEHAPLKEVTDKVSIDINNVPASSTQAKAKTKVEDKTVTTTIKIPEIKKEEKKS